jgi:DNA-binding transcriptional LysR family regulator
MAVTMTQLSAFLAVVRTGSVTSAAEALVVTQPSVSAAVSALEREVGVQLTERAGRGIKPTPAGLTYARYASDVMALLREGSEAAAEAARGVTDRVRVAAVTTAGEYLLPALIRGFREHRPDLDVSVYVDNRQEVFRQLGAREADVAISGRPPEDGGFEGAPFLENEFVLIAAPTDPMAQRPWVPVRELAERSWLMREEGSGTRRLCEAYLASHQLTPPLLTLGSNGAIKSAARMGLGIALQSQAAVGLEVSSGQLATIRPRGGLPKRQWHVVRSTVGPASEATEAFAEYVRSSAEEALERARGI